LVLDVRVQRAVNVLHSVRRVLAAWAVQQIPSALHPLLHQRLLILQQVPGAAEVDTRRAARLGRCRLAHLAGLRALHYKRVVAVYQGASRLHPPRRVRFADVSNVCPFRLHLHTYKIKIRLMYFNKQTQYDNLYKIMYEIRLDLLSGFISKKIRMKI
jgi:hypothetical protein